MKYRAEIDGLRALAVLPVIFFHAGFELFGGGFVGVDVFFVISGYLITTIIISEMGEGKFSIVNFYERRARRILPALFFVMAACIPFAGMWLSPPDLKDFGQSLVAVSIFSSNILFWLESGYFDTASELKPLLHTWSLAVEEQYYIIFPLFMIVTWRLGLIWILGLLSLIFLISIGIAQWSAFNAPSAAFYLLPSRAWELLIGVFAAFYLRHRAHLKSHMANQFLSVLGFSMIIYSIIMFDERIPFPSFYALIPTLGTGLLILCAVPKTFIHKLLSLKPIVGIGLISYSAYLWHQPLLAFTRHKLFFDDISNFLLFIICILSLLMAWISYRFVEKPFRDRIKIGRRAIFISSLVSMMIFSVIGIYLHKTSQMPLSVTLSNKQIDFPIKYNGIVHNGKKCSSPKLQSQEDLCEIQGSSEADKIILIGDSHARVLSEAFYTSSSVFQSLIDLSASGCPFLLDININVGGTVNCSSDYQLARKNILLEKSDSIVIYQARLPLYFYGDGFDNGKSGGKEVRPKVSVSSSFIGSNNNSQKLFLNSLRDSIEFIAKTNKSLFIILPSFSNGWDPLQRLVSMEKSKLSFEEAQDLLSISIDRVEKRVGLIRALLEKISQEHENITVINPNDIFCSELSCSPITSDGKLLFTDADHFSLDVNNAILNKIFESLNEELR
jgi:peptidoglycan/LPS O-acetylase OafA/YrhL